MNSILDYIINKKYGAYIFIAMLSSFFFLGLGQVHLFDWDEINFAESAREMIVSGNYLRVQINFEPFWEKPPLFFWFQVAAMKIFGMNEYAARLPNAIFGFIYLLTFYTIGKKHFSAKFGLIWVLLFFGSLLPHLYFKTAIIDPVFNYFIFMSIYFLLHVMDSDNPQKFQNAILSGIFSGLSVITKGPVGFLLLGLTLLIYLIIYKFKPFPKWKHIATFFVSMILIVGAWLSMEVFQNGFGILNQFIAYQIELFNTPVAGHQQPFYYHFVVVLIGCFPISVFALSSFFKKEGESPLNLSVWMLCLFWVVMILFSIVSTKIVHYSSMAYIPLSFLATHAIYEAIIKRKIINFTIKALYLLMGGIVGLILTILPILLINQEKVIPYIKDEFVVASLRWAIPWSGYESFIGLFYLVCLAVSFYFLRKKMIEKSIIISSLGLGSTLLLAMYFIVPKIESISQGAAISLIEEHKGEDSYIQTYGYKSYAQYYYGNLPFGLRKESKELEWLLNGEIDKPVYLISKITNKKLLDHPNFEFLKNQGGFSLYFRSIEP